jgi:hypothetical protein
LLHEQNEVDQYKGLATERQNRIVTLEGQLNDTILDRNNWQSRFMEEQVKVTDLQNRLNLSKTELDNLTAQYNLYYQKVHNSKQPEWFDVGDPFIGLFRFDCYTGTLEVNIDRNTHKITYSFPNIN